MSRRKKNCLTYNVDENISFNIINNIINSKWNDCCNYTIDDVTKEFISIFINKYFDCIKMGLIDIPYNQELRKKLFKELLDIITDKNNSLYRITLDCLNDIENINNTENILINSIFKLQSYIEM